MTLCEFRNLSFKEQAEATWQGEFCATREDREHLILLYLLDTMFVEVYYNNMTNEIVWFTLFVSKKRLTLYLGVQLN